MGLFFNFNKQKTERKTVNSFLEDQKSVFDTEGPKEKIIHENNYDEYLYKPKDYSDVPKYAAEGSKGLDVVIDEDGFEYNNLNPDIKTVNIQKNNLHEDLNEIVSNGPIDDSSKTEGTSIYDEKIDEEIKQDTPVEIIDIDDTDTVIEDFENQDIDKSKKLSIFGSSDEPIQAKVYDVKEVIKEEKIDIIEPIIQEQKDVEVKRPEYCPKCGAPISEHADTCFLCGNKF